MTKRRYAYLCRDIQDHLIQLSKWLDCYDEYHADSDTFQKTEANKIISNYRAALSNLKTTPEISDNDLTEKIEFAYQLITDTKKFIYANAKNFNRGERTLLNEMQFKLQDIVNSYFQIALLYSYLQSAMRCCQIEKNVTLKQKKAECIREIEEKYSSHDIHLASAPSVKLSLQHSLFKNGNKSRKQLHEIKPAKKETMNVI